MKTLTIYEATGCCGIHLIKCVKIAIPHDCRNRNDITYSYWVPQFGLHQSRSSKTENCSIVLASSTRRPRYSPSMPIASRILPERKETSTAREAQPGEE